MAQLVESQRVEFIVYPEQLFISACLGPFKLVLSVTCYWNLIVFSCENSWSGFLVGQWLGLGAEPPGSRVEGVVGLRDVHLVESVGSQKLVQTLYLPSRGHCGNRIIDHFLVQDSTALLSEPLLQM